MTSKKMQDGEFIIGGIPDTSSRLTEMVTTETRYRYRFDRDIGDVDEYSDLLEFLANSDGDYLEMVFACNGGNVDTMIAIINAVNQSNVHCHGSLLSHAYSAASAIFLNCSSHDVSANSKLMIHEQQSYGVGGKASDLSAYVEFETKQHRRLMNRLYEGFLTEKEIEQFLCGKEFWLGDDEIIDRLNDMYAHFKEDVPSDIVYS